MAYKHDPNMITANEIAAHYGISEYMYREQLRLRLFSWHMKWAPWIAKRGSDEHHDMDRVAKRMAKEKTS